MPLDPTILSNQARAAVERYGMRVVLAASQVSDGTLARLIAGMRVNRGSLALVERGLAELPPSPATKP